MPFYRLHVPILALLTVMAVCGGTIVGHFSDHPSVKPKISVVRPMTVRGPNVGRLVTECVLTLAELPYYSTAREGDRVIRVVQEPYFEPESTELLKNAPALGASLLWFLESKRDTPFEQATVLGYVVCDCYPQLFADVAFDANSGRYWVVLAQLGSGSLDLRVHTIDPCMIVAPDRTSLVNSQNDAWPWPSELMAYTRFKPFKTGNPRSSIDDVPLTMRVSSINSLRLVIETQGSESSLVVEAHDCQDHIAENHSAAVQSHANLCSIRYLIHGRKWSSNNTVEVPRPAFVPTMRDDLNRKHRVQWLSMISSAAERRRIRNHDAKVSGNVNANAH